MLTEMQIDLFEKNGFLNAGELIDADQIGELSDELERIIATGPDGFGPEGPRPVLFRDLTGGSYTDAGEGEAGPTPVWQIVNIWEASQAFERLLYHPAVVRAISQLSRFGDLQVWHDQVQYKPANIGGATNWHQDAPKWPSIEPMTPVSAWIPLDDAFVENGCMWMVPGSHKWGEHDAFLDGKAHLKTIQELQEVGWGFTPPDDAPIREVRVVSCPVKRGEVHFHHSLTWHASPLNKSSLPRRALAIHYMTGEARYTGRQHPMQPFIQVQPGEPMFNAGPHFPVVCRKGVPVGSP